MAIRTITPAEYRELAAKSMLERDLSQLVFDAARKRRWLVARYPTFRATQTTPGFPDLVLLRKGRLIVAELKREREEPSEEQKDWLEGFREAGVDVRVWRPSDWLSGDIEEILR